MKKIIKTIINLKLQIPLIILGVLIIPIVAFAVVKTLNGQAGDTQTFSNDTNVTITSGSNIHSLGWNGILPVSRGGTGASSFTGGSVLFSSGAFIAQDNSNLFWDDANNWLGIGTSQPTSPLHVIGNALVSDNFTAGALISSADSIINSLTVGLGGGFVASNTAIGKDALKYNTTGYNNTAVGFMALANQGSGGDNTAVGNYALASNTTGSDQNTAVGGSAMKENTTGRFNTAVGVSALRANTTGEANTALGLGSLFNTNASYNTAVGMYAMTENTTGIENVAVGVLAGQKQADGSSLTTPRYSIYIGSTARGLDNNDNNSIVIGGYATGAGANTAVIGNSNLTDVYLGSSSGNAKLHASNISTVSSGTLAPSSTPTALGQIYVDTSVAKVYISTGTSSSADWTIMN